MHSSPSPAPDNSGTVVSPMGWPMKMQIRAKRYWKVQLFRKLTPVETAVYTFIATLAAALLIAFPAYLLAIGTGDNFIRESLKALQFSSKIFAFLGGAIAFLGRQTLNRYIVGFFLAAFAVDFGVDTFLYYAGESTLPKAAKSIIVNISLVSQLFGVGGLVMVMALAVQDVSGIGWRKLRKKN